MLKQENASCHVYIQSRSTVVLLPHRAEGDGPKRQPQQGSDPEEEPAPLDVVRGHRPGRHGSHQVSNGHDHPARVDVLLVAGERDPAEQQTALKW